MYTTSIIKGASRVVPPTVKSRSLIRKTPPIPNMRSFFTIPKEDNRYGYLTLEDLGIKPTAWRDHMQDLFTTDFKKKNPDIDIAFNRIITSQGDSLLHSDTGALHEEIVYADLPIDGAVLIHPNPEDKKTVFLPPEANGLLEEVGDEIYQAKDRDSSKQLTEMYRTAVQQHPSNAVITYFYTKHLNGDPLIHCAPVGNSTSDKVLGSFFKTGRKLPTMQESKRTILTFSFVDKNKMR